MFNVNSVAKAFLFQRIFKNSNVVFVLKLTKSVNKIKYYYNRFINLTLKLNVTHVIIWLKRIVIIINVGNAVQVVLFIINNNNNISQRKEKGKKVHLSLNVKNAVKFSQYQLVGKVSLIVQNVKH